MSLVLDERELAFQQEVREFLQHNLTEEILHESLATSGVFPDKELALAWQQKLAAKGWAAPLWPEQYGGINWTQKQKYIFEVESAKAGAPLTIPLGLKMVGPVIIKYGSEHQKQRFLPRILSGEDYWCQGYSEPGSGSDLASLKCKAELVDGHYLVNGSKIWTTHAHFANWIFCLVRTSKEKKPQQGISFLLIPMDTPGISVKPITSISGQHDLNEVFFEDVKVPQENLVGEPGQGWTYAKYLLELERGAGAASARLRANLIRVTRLCQQKSMNSTQESSFESLYVNRLIELDAAITALEYTELRAQKHYENGCESGAESSLLKTEATEIEQQLARLAVELLGPEAMVLKREKLTDSHWPIPKFQDSYWAVPRYLNSLAASIYGGTNEIQRNLIARTILTRS